MIDENRLDDLEREIGAESLRAVIVAFLDEASAAVGDLEGLTDREQAPLRDRRLHFLKGCARTVGARRLGELCAGLEGKSTPLSAADLAGIQSEFVVVREELSARLAGPTG